MRSQQRPTPLRDSRPASFVQVTRRLRNVVPVERLARATLLLQPLRHVVTGHLKDAEAVDQVVGGKVVVSKWFSVARLCRCFDERVDFRDLSDEEQVESLRSVAVVAAELFGLDPLGVELVAHAYNTTFSAEGVDGGRFALRVNTNSQSTRQNVVAQQAWQCAIASETDVLVAAPLATPEGQWYVDVHSEVSERPLVVTAASWLDGPDVTEMDLMVAGQLGRTMALLHDQSQGWAMPPGASMPRFDTPLFGDEDLLSSAPGLSTSDRAALDRALETASVAFTASYDDVPNAAAPRRSPGREPQVDDDQLAVFDFDDCGLGVPSLDLAIAVFYLRGEDPRLERALTAGYAERRPLPDVEPSHFEAMIAARQLLLANSLLTSMTSELQREASNYLAVTVSRLRHWLKTGTFTRVPLHS